MMTGASKMPHEASAADANERVTEESGKFEVNI
jgi:hypothetical protein